MNKNNVSIIYIFLVSLFFSYGYSNTIKTLKEETLFSSASSFLLIQKDSLYSQTYLEVKKLYGEEDYVEALRKALELYDVTKKEGYRELEYQSCFMIGAIYSKNNNYLKSLEYYKKSIEILFQDINDNPGGLNNISYARSLLRVGAAYQKLKNKDSAVLYYDKLDRLYSIDNDILNLKATSLSNLSGIYQRDSLFEKAKLYAQKAIDIHKSRNDKINQAGALSNLGSIYLSLKEFEKAKEFYLEGIKLIEKDNSPTAVRYKANLYYNLAWAMRNLKDYKAYDFQEMSYTIEDGIRDKEIKRMIETVTAQYDVNTVKQQEQLKLLKQKDKTWGVTVLSISILIILIGTIAYFKFRQKNLSLKISRNDLLQQQKIEKLKSESQIRILNATIDGKESERKQIAETLHDSVSTLLSSANLHLQACRSQFNGSTPVEIEKSQKIITEASDKIRDLSHTLVSSVLLKFGLQYSLKDMADKYSNSQIEIKTDISDLRRYDQGFEIKAYNIIQEFINNILKHSKATKAELKLYEEDQKLMLSINDNGQGFNKDLIPEKDGLGINQIDARIKMMQGKFTIESSEGKGTKIIVELPIQERETVTIA